jgi:hypothetical protein
MPASYGMYDCRLTLRLRQRKESAVSIEEIVHTCSNEKVALAAVASLGFDFASRVRTEAEGHGTTTGVFVARIVHEFGEVADAGERNAVSRAMDRTDQPILIGLRVILEGRLRLSQKESRWPVESVSHCQADTRLRAG